MITKLAATLLLLSSAAVVKAEVIDYTITGIVNGAFDNAGLFGPPGTQLGGDAFTAKLEFDLAGASTAGTFQSVNSPPVESSLSVNGHTLSNFATAGWAFVSLGSTFGLSATAQNNTDLSFDWGTPNGQLPVTSLSAFGMYSIPPEPLMAFDYFDPTGKTLETQMNLDAEALSITPAPVPIPPTMWLLLSGLGGILALRGRWTTRKSSAAAQRLCAGL